MADERAEGTVKKGLLVLGLTAVAVLVWRARERDRELREVWIEVTDPVT